MLGLLTLVTSKHLESDWIEPSTLKHAFEARSARLAIRCAMQIASAASPEAGSQ
jgi:hypothetical protein